MSELTSTLQPCNSKSPGPDNILYSFFKNLPVIGVQKLFLIYNTIWTQGFFPTQWRNSNVIPIPKPDKSKFEIEKYRPISLISTLSKLLKKIINKRLIWMLEFKNLLTKTQCGFRRNHSTLDVLTSIHTDICSSYRSKQHLITIVLDIKKTYDTVWKNRVLTILHKWELNGNLLNFIKNCLANHKFCIRINNHYSSSHDILNRLPQGSALSVTLFLVANYDICEKLPKPVKYILFADNCHIYWIANWNHHSFSSNFPKCPLRVVVGVWFYDFSL